MPVDAVLRYDADPSIEPFIVPVPEGSTPEDVAKAWPGWSVVPDAVASEVAADLAASHAAAAAAASVADDAAPVQPAAASDVPAEPATPAPAPAEAPTAS